ncbi:hypothetical protein WI77_31850 [Burkholderia ubonensis]|nr:hypothetical protein WI77_31850 [Burkholderia ubonensis]
MEASMSGSWVGIVAGTFVLALAAIVALSRHRREHRRAELLSFAWAARFRRLARDYERLPHTLAGFHFLAFACLMLPKIIDFIHIGS